jgi:HB1/ASXL restriction endonuclease-like protein with HTH domain
MPTLLRVKPGTRFRLREMPEVTGVVVKATESRAVVRLDRPVQEVEFVDQEGQSRRFQSRGTRETSFTSAVVVDVIGFEPLANEENDMSKTKAKKTATKAAKVKSADGKLSCLDAAAKVLASAKEPMTTKALIEQMASKGLWSSPNGQTPAATLYSAILREITTKGKEARFKKADRGLFAATN